jgi:hypothetical protein
MSACRKPDVHGSTNVCMFHYLWIHVDGRLVFKLNIHFLSSLLAWSWHGKAEVKCLMARGKGPTFRAIVFRAQCDDQGVNLAEKDRKCNARKKAYNGLDGCMQNAVVMTTISASRPQDPGPFHFANRTLRALLPHYDAFVKVRMDWNLLLILFISMVSLVAYIGLRVYHLVTGKTKAMEGDNVKVWYSWVAVCAETLTSMIGFYSGMLVWRQYVRFQAVSVEDSRRLHAVRILLCQSACSMPC